MDARTNCDKFKDFRYGINRGGWKRKLSSMYVSNVVFSNGWIADEDGTVFIYYASSDTRMHVATSSVSRLIDYVVNTPADGYSSLETVKVLNQVINNNIAYTTQQTTKEDSKEDTSHERLHQQ